MDSSNPAVFELDHWRQCSVLSFEGTSVAVGPFSVEVGFFNGCNQQYRLPRTVDRVQDVKGKGKKGKKDYQKGKGKDAKGKGKKGKGEQQKGKEGDHKGKGKGKDQKGKGVATCYTCGQPGRLARDCWRIFDRLQVIQPTHLEEELQ